MEEFFEGFFEILIERFLIRFIGINLRFALMKPFYPSLKKEDLLKSVKGKLKEETSNDFINAVFGLLGIFLFSFFLYFLNKYTAG